MLLRRWLSAVLLGIVCLACTPAGERAERARQSAIDALARGDRAAALASIGDLRASLGASPERAAELAQLLVAAGSAPEAGWLLEDAVRRYPERYDLRVVLARVSLLLANPALALEVAAAVPPEAPEHLAASLTRARAELDLGDLQAALDTLAEAERRHPDRPEAQLLRISALFSERRTDEARTAMQALLAGLKGDDERTVALRRRLRVALAQIRAQAGEGEAAVRDLETVLAEAPGEGEAWQALAQVLARDGRAEEALDRLAGARSAGASDPVLLLLEARLRAGLGQTEAVEAALRRYVEVGGSGAAYRPLLEFYSARGEDEQVLALLREATGRFPDEPRLHLLRTEALLEGRRLAAARGEASRFAEATFEGDPQIEYLAARLALAEGDSAGAAERLRNLAPRLDRAATHFWLGRALEESGDRAGAARRYALAERRDPRWSAPAMALTSLAARRGNWEAVASHASDWVHRAPQQIGGWLAWIDALERVGDGKRAETIARRCLEQFPNRPEPHRMLARALRAQGRSDEALAELDAIPSPGPVERAERVRTLGLAGRVAEGIELGRRAIAADPEVPALHAALAALLYAAGEEQEGARATDRALELAPDEPRPLRVRCEFRASVGLWQKAREDCSHYLTARPDDAGAWFLLGISLAQLGETSDAVSAYRRSATLDERDARSRNNLAGLLAARGDLDEALAVSQEAYRLDGESPAVQDTLGELYRRQGLTERAVSLLEAAHAAAPGMPDAALHLALAYGDQGRRTDARTLLASVLADGSASVAVRAEAREALDALP